MRIWQYQYVCDASVCVCIYSHWDVCVVRVHQRFKISEWKCIKTKVKRENIHTYIRTHMFDCLSVCLCVCVCMYLLQMRR